MLGSLGPYYGLPEVEAERTWAKMGWRLSFVLCKGEVKMNDSALFPGGHCEPR